jgi:hypothetical protein
MADSDKNIIITPNRGATGSTGQPQIRFVGQNADPITLRVLDITGSSAGAISFEGSAGQLFSITNSLTSGSLFSVNDISGLPSIDVNANGTILFAGFTGNVGIGATAGISGSAYKLTVVGSANILGNLVAPNVVTGVNGITGAVSITSGSNITITQSGKTITIASSGGGSPPLATSSVTGVASFRAADFDVSTTGSVSLTGTVARTNTSQTFTGLQTFSSGISANGITGTILTPSQTTITSVGVLNGLSVNNGLSVTGSATITGGATVYGDIEVYNGGFIRSGGLSVTGGLSVANGSLLAGIVTAPDGITANHLYASGATFVNAIYAPNMVTGVNGITGAVSITSGSNITITQSGKQITIASGGGLVWSVVTADQSITINTGTFANKSSGTLTLTLPTTAAVGTSIRVSGMQNTWRIAQNASQIVNFGKVSTTTGTGGYIESTNARDSVELVCCVADTQWNVVSSIGNITIV